MVKVTQGNLPGQRAEGYHQYRGGFEKGEGFGVRRTLPTSNIQTKGDTIAQKRQKEDFGLASKIYSSWDILQKDFFTRGGIVDIRYDKKGKRIKRYLRGARWAIHDITTKLNAPSSPYPSPLGFCICGVDLQGEPAPGFTLNITTDKLRDFTYSEKNCEDGCFMPSALSPLYEPYHLWFTGARDYGLLTAEEIHQITTLHVHDYTEIYTATLTWMDAFSSSEWFYQINFQEWGITTPTADIMFIVTEINEKPEGLIFMYFEPHTWPRYWMKTDAGETKTFYDYVTVGDGTRFRRNYGNYSWDTPHGKGTIIMTMVII